MGMLCLGCNVECSCTGYGFFIGPNKVMLVLCESCYLTLRKEIHDLESGETLAKFYNSFNKEY